MPNQVERGINALTSDPQRPLIHLLSKVYVLLLSFQKNVEIAGRLYISGRPLIDIRKGSRLIIGDDVVLGSRNKGYHVNLHSPVKLFADRPGALIRIGDRTRIHGTCIHAYTSISIGSNCLIAANCQIIDSNGHELSFPDVDQRINSSSIGKPIIIEDNVWIGVNTIILPGVVIGYGSVISANSVVATDIPPLAIARGNPATVIKEYSDAPGDRC